MAREYTTVEGVLTAGFDPSICLVRDPLTDRPTACMLSPSIRDQAAAMVGRRVSLSGEAMSGRDDFPVLMLAVEIHEFPDPATLSKLLDGVTYNITDGMDAVEFVRRQRDAV